MNAKKFQTVLFLGDGMADEPVESLGHKTPLQAAKTPNMDTIAKFTTSVKRGEYSFESRFASCLNDIDWNTTTVIFDRN